MVGALIGAGVAIGTALYNKNASAADKRKARKRLRRLAKDYGIAYDELKDTLGAYFAAHPMYEDKSAELGGLAESADSTADANKPVYTGYGKTREQTYNEYLDALYDVVGGNANAFDESVRKNKNVYASAMDEFEAERNADYKSFQDKIDQYAKFLNAVNQQSKNNSAGLLAAQGYANKWNDNNLATLVNLMAAKQQTQNNLTSQALGI